MRELINCRIEAISKVKDDPYNEGQKQRSILLLLPSLDEEGNPEKEWINLNTRVYAPWLKTIKRGDNVPMLMEWSPKKKNRKTGETGALAYRPVLIKCHIESPGLQEAPLDLSSLEVVRAFLRWLCLPLKGEAPMRRLINSLVKEEVLTKDEAKAAGQHLLSAGTIVGELIEQSTNKTPG